MKQGTNVKAQVSNNILTVVVDLTAQGVASKSGKSTVIGGTNGFTEVAPGVSMNLNVIRMVQLTEDQKKAVKQAMAEAKKQAIQALVKA